MNAKRLSVLLLLLLPALCAQSQWRSAHATQTTTETITKPDGSVLTNRATSEYTRSASGSELTVTIMRTPDGLVTRRIAKLYDADAPAQYNLDYAAKTAYLIVRMPAPKPFETNRIARYPGLQQGTYAGIECVLVPATLEGKRIGTVWVDDKDSLELKSDITFPGSHTVTELSNITMDSKYDPTIFRIPADFTVDTSESRTFAVQK